jgi:hypothetical protein
MKEEILLNNSIYNKYMLISNIGTLLITLSISILVYYHYYYIKDFEKLVLEYNNLSAIVILINVILLFSIGVIYDYKRSETSDNHPFQRKIYFKIFKTYNVVMMLFASCLFFKYTYLFVALISLPMIYRLSLYYFIEKYYFYDMHLHTFHKNMVIK